MNARDDAVRVGRLPPRIESAANPRVRAVLRLRDRRERTEAGVTIVDGAREIGRAVAAGAVVREAYHCEELIRTDEARSAALGLRAVAAASFEVSPAILERLAFGDRSDGLVAVVEPPSTSLATLELPLEPLIAVVDGVEKPGNLGAILRTADGAGADAVLVTDPATDPYNPNAIRASLGTIFRLRPVVTSPAMAIQALTARGIRIVTARVDGTRLYHEVDLTGGLAIVVGSEADGLGPEWDGADLLPVRIPMLGMGDSLNVSVAAAILLYEARRQRGLPAT